MPKIPIFEKKNVLVTGGAGFIGSHLCESLLKEAKVVCMDNLISGSLQNIDHLLKYPDFVFLKHDVNEPIEFVKWPELEKFKVQFQGIQEIYHLACPTSPKDFEKYRLDTLKTNSIGTMHVLDLAAKWNAKVLLASSSVVYGDTGNAGKYVAEDYIGPADHFSPRAPYDEGKRFAETALHTCRQVYGIEIRIARIFRTYGPRLKLGIGEMMPDFIVQALEGKPLSIYGNKEFKTSLCYITDTVDGLLKLMNNPVDLGPVNIGSDEECDLVKVAAQIIEMTGSKSKVTFAAPLNFMRPQPLPDIRRAKNELSWFPITRLEDGLKAMIEYTRAKKSLL